MDFYEKQLRAELREVFEEKMKHSRTHPKILLEKAGGPKFADSFYEAMFAVFCLDMNTVNVKLI